MSTYPVWTPDTVTPPTVVLPLPPVDSPFQSGRL